MKHPGEGRRAQSLYCAVFEGKLPSMGSAGPWQEWRNKAIAPYALKIGATRSRGHANLSKRFVF
jgi:hypothetical protein